jgi:putative phosphoribosyl transferase
MTFRDRAEAGAALARQVAGLPDLGSGEGVVVLALPRGGVPVAVPVATALAAALDVLVVRKLGLPRRAELAMGAIAGVGGDVVLVANPDVRHRAQITAAQFAEVLQRETAELRRREQQYRVGRPALAVRDRAVVVVDDGLATGSTMRAAVKALRRMEPVRIVVAVPVGAARTCADLAEEVDDVVCTLQPRPFVAVGQGYRDFSQTTDAEVSALLEEYAIG